MPANGDEASNPAPLAAGVGRLAPAALPVDATATL